MKTSESIKELTKAMAEFHGEVGAVIKTRRGNFGPYADVNSVLETISPLLQKHGLSVRQFVDLWPSSSSYVTVLVTRLSHVSGEFEEGACPLAPVVPCDGKGAQGFGAYLSYMRRYCLTSALALATEEDDDGQSDQDAAEAKRKPPTTAQAVKATQGRAEEIKNYASPSSESFSFPPPGTKENPSEKLTAEEQAFMRAWIAQHEATAGETLKNYKNEQGFRCTLKSAWAMDRGEFQRFKKDMKL